MTIVIPQNFYRETITRAVTLTGATNIYVSALPTPAEGYITISPASTTLREIIYYTAKGTDANGSYLTVTLANRGLGGTTAQTHIIGEPVRMNVGAETIEDISDAIDQIVAAGAQDASMITKGIVKMSVAPASATNPIAVGDNDPRVPTADPTTIFSLKKFGGTGADGALTITSGATNIDLGSAQVVTKNYTSISITGTGSLTFTNPHANGTVIILKSQGNVTLTSSTAPMIDASGMGGNSDTNGWSMMSALNKGATGTGTRAGGTGVLNHLITNPTFAKNVHLFTGGGGGSSNAVAGGRGGGGLYIECAGALNFTTASGISVAGKVGTANSGTSGGGGGGAGGCCIIFYNSLTAASGTITISGGTGGQGLSAPSTPKAGGAGGNGLTGGTGTGGNGGGPSAGGGGGASCYQLANGSNGTAGDYGAGGGGASGYYLMTSNTDFA